MNSRWTGIVLAVLIGAILLMVGKWQLPGTPVSLVILALLGTLFPPAAFLVGGLILLGLVLRYGVAILGDWTGSWTRLQQGFNSNYPRGQHG